MKLKVVIGVVIMLVGAAGFNLFQPFHASAMHDPIGLKLNGGDPAEILSATLQIEISVPADAIGSRQVKAKGLGSLIWDGQETLLVTHNHWGDVLQDLAAVEVYDARGQIVEAMSGAEFNSQVVYQDAGTLILRSPVESQKRVVAVDPPCVQVGDVVWVVQRDGAERKKATLVEAEVESITFYEGLPVYRLRGAGKPVQGGDSGGGVWHQGELVGNLYATIMVKPTLFSFLSFWEPDADGLKATYESYAVIYPPDGKVAFQEPLMDYGRKE